MVGKEIMRIEEKMAMTGSITRGQDDVEDTPTARPESPVTLDDDPQAALTDIEDMEEQGNVIPQGPYSNTLHVPGASAATSSENATGSDEVHTDTELVTTETEDDDADMNTPLSEEQAAKLMESYQNAAEGQISVEGNMGEKMIVSQVTRLTPGLNSRKQDEEVLTDMEDVEGDDEDIQIDIVDVGAGSV